MYCFPENPIEFTSIRKQINYKKQSHSMYEYNK